MDHMTQVFEGDAHLDQANVPSFKRNQLTFVLM